MSTKAKDLPPVASLSDRQRRGADCVHCGAVLVAGDVTDLGPQDTLGYTWFPRTHPRHLEGEAS